MQDENNPLSPDSPLEKEIKSPPLPKKKWWQSWILSFCIALILMILLRWLVLEPFLISGDSMDPGLKDRQIVFVNKTIYFGGTIHRQDILIFRHPLYSQKKLIKRVIGLGGDEVEIRKGKVYLNGKLLKEPYVMHVRMENMAPLMVPKDHYFVLGDNRTNSMDSRQGWVVKSKDVIGVAFWRVFPWKDFSGL